MNALHVGSELRVYGSYPSCKSTRAAALRTCNEKQAPNLQFLDVVAMESIARVRDLKVLPVSFVANYYSSGVTVSMQHTQNRYTR